MGIHKENVRVLTNNESKVTLSKSLCENERRRPHGKTNSEKQMIPVPTDRIKVSITKL